MIRLRNKKISFSLGTLNLKALIIEPAIGLKSDCLKGHPPLIENSCFPILYVEIYLY